MKKSATLKDDFTRLKPYAGRVLRQKQCLPGRYVKTYDALIKAL